MNRKNIYYWLLLPVLALMMGACGESSNNEDPAKPDTPVTPVAEEDWQTVPASGGTIKKGDIALTFPAGTFDTDTKVAITEVEKGEILGEDEVSTFYQVTMPVSASRPMTISIKNEKQSGEVSFVTYVPSHSLHNPDSVTYAPISYEATYSDGQYTATLPAFENAGMSGTISISMGLGNIVQFSSGTDIDQTSATRLVIHGETEGDISWHYEVGSMFYIAFNSRLKTVIPQMNLFLHEAIQEITRLGFTVGGKRDIPILFKTLYEPGQDVVWGYFNQHPTNDAKSWLELDTRLMTQFDANKQEVKQTVFHEVFHYFQSAYDNRTPFGKLYCGDELMLYEAGGVWVERFANGGVPPSSQYSNYIATFIKSLTNIEETYKNAAEAKEDRFGKWIYNLFGNDGRVFNINLARRYHGYAMGSLIEYFGKEYGNDKIVDLYSDWKKNSKSKLQTTFDALKTFAKAKGSTIFSGTYDYFVEEILTGRLIPGVSAYHAWDRLRDLNTSHMSYDEKGTCYPFGADIVWFPLDFSNDYSFDGKELVIRNDNPKDSYLHTNIYTRYNVRKTIPYETILWPGDSLVIPADSLNNLLKAQRRTSGFYTVTSSYDESGKRSSNIKVEIRDIKPTIKPTEMSFEAEGGTQEAKVTAPGYSYFGVRVDEAYSNWLSATPTKGGKVTVTAKANSTSEPRTGYVKSYVAKSAEASESEWVWLTPIKVTQKAGEANNRYIYAVCTPNLDCTIMALSKSGDYVKTGHTLYWSSSVSSDRSGYEMTQDDSGHHFSQTESYTIDDTHYETTLTFSLSGLEALSSGGGSIGNVKSEYREKSSTKEVYMAIEISGFKYDSYYDYENGLVTVGWAIRGKDIQPSQLKYTEHVNGKLTKEFYKLNPRDDNFVSMSVTFRK